VDDTLVSIPSMIIYENTAQGFMNDVARNEVTERSLFDLKGRFEKSRSKRVRSLMKSSKIRIRRFFSRGIKGCYIYCCDDQLREYPRSRLVGINGTIEPWRPQIPWCTRRPCRRIGATKFDTILFS